ncbi:toxin-antitoxin system HicB family antitoxin [Acinetobacter sp. CFCC 10889]|uniref:toxin-antitoxin system HicB family antitoxin n=1 Tax=Acinetobacter sp. CFCC 10889 TaxID=1775557 RepID=UPI000DCFA245|nr:toxin-antitoxin system HicB family antitoxin [Acinetobacter sp. CFCC 10889]
MKKVLPIRTQIRIPPDLHARLVEEANKNESSLNDAMIFYIERGFHSAPHEDDFEKAVENIPTEILMMELASRMKGYTLTVMEKVDNKKAP